MRTSWGRASAAGLARSSVCWRSSVGWIVALLLTACQGAVNPAISSPLPTGTTGLGAPSSTPSPAQQNVVQPGVQDAISAAATAGVTAPPGFQTPANTSAERLVQPTAVQPLQFVFPTPIAYSAPANWRPPVLGVPLAVRAEDHFWFARPIASDSVNYPLGTYRYGSNYFGQMNVHAGIDIDAPPYTPVLAAGPGRVAWAGYGLFNFQLGRLDDPYGNAVAILHDFGFNNQPLYTVYAHMIANNVYLGETVKTGDVIGWVGSTGNSTGPHLHFEVREGTNGYYFTRNPELWIAPYSGWGVLAGRLVTAGGNPVDAASIDIYDASNNLVDTVYTYGPQIVRPDDAWKENFVISDLPAGNYFLVASIANSPTETDTVQGEVNVIAGQTNFIVMQANTGVVGNSALDVAHPPAFLPTYTPSYTPTPTDTPTPTSTRTPRPTATATATRRPFFSPTP
jgi:murein DD-endopeptidase MepM/ murein hydrolase activator NlpD